MKKSLNSPFVFLMLLFFFAFAFTGVAQAPPHPPSEKGTEYNQGPAGAASAPVGNGLPFLLILGAAYGLSKIRQVHTKVSSG